MSVGLQFLWLLGVLGCIAAPAAFAWHSGRGSRRASEFAAGLTQFAREVRAKNTPLPFPEELERAAVALAVPEQLSFTVALTLARLPADELAAAAERLATRVRRRIAFERKMRARTLPGRRRAALVGAMPILLLLAGVPDVDASGLATSSVGCVLLLEAAGAALLWRFAKVEI
jgi:hypothetical protein